MNARDFQDFPFESSLLRHLTVDLRFKFDHYPKHVKEKDKTRWKQMQQKLDQRQRQKETYLIDRDREWLTTNSQCD